MHENTRKYKKVNDRLQKVRHTVANATNSYPHKTASYPHSYPHIHTNNITYHQQLLHVVFKTTCNNSNLAACLKSTYIYAYITSS